MDEDQYAIKRLILRTTPRTERTGGRIINYKFPYFN